MNEPNVTPAATSAAVVRSRLKWLIPQSFPGPLSQVKDAVPRYRGAAPASAALTAVRGAKTAQPGLCPSASDPLRPPHLLVLRRGAHAREAEATWGVLHAA